MNTPSIAERVWADGDPQPGREVDTADHDTYAMPDLVRLAPTTPATHHADPAPRRRRSGQWDGQPGVAYAYSGRGGAVGVLMRRRTRKESR